MGVQPLVSTDAVTIVDFIFLGFRFFESRAKKKSRSLGLGYKALIFCMFFQNLVNYGALLKNSG